MPLFDRETRKRADPWVDPDQDLSAPQGSSSDAEESAAHIAALVRRTSERQSSPRPSSIPLLDDLGSQPDMRQPAPGPPHYAQRYDAPPAPRARRRPSITMAVSTVGAVAAVLVAGTFAMTHGTGTDPGGKAVAASAAPAGYTVQVTDAITDCARHSHGRTRVAFHNQNCLRATRSLATGQVSGRRALFVVSKIEMPSVDAAASVKQVLDSTGTGNLNDLLREGRTFPGAPAKMPSSGYASVQTGPVVLVAEAGYLGGGASSNSIPALRAAAAQVAGLVTTAN